MYPPLACLPDLLEVVDEKNSPLILMSREQVLRLGLPHRRIMVSLMDWRGRTLLCRRKKMPALWHISSIRLVPAGASGEDTAGRALLEDWNLRSISLRQASPWLPCEENGHAFVHFYPVSLSKNLLLTPSEDILEYLFLDQDELLGMTANFPESIAPEVRWALEGRHLSGGNTLR